MLYSPSERGFWDIGATDAPRDVVPVDANVYAELIRQQSQGMEIVPDGSGQPVAVPNVPVLPAVPASVSMFQARAALLDAELLDAVQSALDGMPEGTPKRRAMLAWDYAQTVDRDSQFTAMLAAALDLDDAALDRLFVAAAAIR